MGLFYKRDETEERVIICFKYMWLLWVLLLAPFFISIFLKIKIISYIPVIVAIIYLVDTSKVRSEIKNAMKKEGITFQGSKFSISNPTTVTIKK